MEVPIYQYKDGTEPKGPTISVTVNIFGNDERVVYSDLAENTTVGWIKKLLQDKTG